MPRPILSTQSESTVLSLFPAGGITRSQDWLDIADASRQLADSNIYLTSHSSLELRNISDGDAVIQRLATTTLHTSPCRVVASPLNSRARELARLIGEAAPESTKDNIVIGVDSGDGLIASHHPHVCVTLIENTTEVRVNVLEREIRTEISEAPSAVAEILQGLNANKTAGAQLADAELINAPLKNSQLPIGWLAEHMPSGRVELGVGLFDGVMSAEIAEILGKMEVPVTITPWKGLVLHDLSEGDADVVVRVLAPRGLIFDANSPFL